MIRHFLNWLVLRLAVRLIRNEEGRTYLLRARLWGWMPGDDRKAWSGYLHRFMLPDSDRALHNHPWRWSFSLVLAGGYEEERLDKTGKVITRRVRPGMLNFLGRNSFHRVTELHGKETWSLFIAGPKFSSWGFLDPDKGFVNHHDWFAMKGIEE